MSYFETYKIITPFLKLSMKNVILLFLSLIFLFACSSQKRIFETINEKNAHRIRSFDETNIESMVTFYFASRIRNDEQWRKVLPDSSEWSSRMKHSIAKHNQWKFVEFKNLGIYKGQYGTYVKVYFMIEVNGKKDGGKDDVELRRENDRWKR